MSGLEVVQLVVAIVAIFAAAAPKVSKWCKDRKDKGKFADDEDPVMELLRTKNMIEANFEQLRQKAGGGFERGDGRTRRILEEQHRVLKSGLLGMVDEDQVFGAARSATAEFDLQKLRRLTSSVCDLTLHALHDQFERQSLRAPSRDRSPRRSLPPPYSVKSSQPNFYYDGYGVRSRDKYGALDEAEQGGYHHDSAEDHYGDHRSHAQAPRPPPPEEYNEESYGGNRSRRFLGSGPGAPRADDSAFRRPQDIFVTCMKPYSRPGYHTYNSGTSNMPRVPVQQWVIAQGLHQIESRKLGRSGPKEWSEGEDDGGDDWFGQRGRRTADRERLALYGNDAYPRQGERAPSTERRMFDDQYAGGSYGPYGP